uniref:Uncharacterized protein n=1 Tax=Lotus japonicus TaxID=34305 RepID=I3S4S5_LOTJA|nr:unknown [Lotus japonicus]
MSILADLPRSTASVHVSFLLLSCAVCHWSHSQTAQ